jgi:hypothetical protein
VAREQQLDAESRVPFTRTMIPSHQDTQLRDAEHPIPGSTPSLHPILAFL